MNSEQVRDKVYNCETPVWVISSDWAANLASLDSSYCIHYEKQSHSLLNQKFYRRVEHLHNAELVKNNSQMYFEFNPTYQSILFHSISIIRNGSTIDKLTTAKKKVIQRESEAHDLIYTGIWTFIAILEDVRIGDVLECSYTYEGVSEHHKDCVMDNFYFNFSEPLKSILLRIVSPEVFLKYHNCSYTPSVVKNLENNIIDRVWHLKDLEPFSYEDNLPSWYMFPWLQITSFKNWSDVANWATQLFIKSSIENSIEVKQLIENWLAQYSDTKKLALVIIRFVQNEIRYFSLSEDLGFRSADPEETFKRRFGDCKDKSWLLCHLLNAVGVKAYPMLVNSHLKQNVIELLPSPMAFNHVIVTFTLNNETFWVDPTGLYEGGSSIDVLASLNYGIGLVIREFGEQRNCLEEIKNNENKSKIVSKLIFDLRYKVNVIKLETESRFYFNEADTYRQYLSQVKIKDLQEGWIEYLRNYYKKIVVLEEIKIHDNFEDNEIVRKASYEIDQVVNRNEKCYSCWFYPFSIIRALSLNFPSCERKTPLAIQYPLDLTEEIVIKLNDYIPYHFEDELIKNKYFEFTLEFECLDKLTHLHRYTLRTYQDHILPSELEDIKKEIERINATIALSYKIEKSKSFLFKEINLGVWGYLLTVSLFFILLRFFLIMFSKV